VTQHRYPIKRSPRAATVERLPLYLRATDQLLRSGEDMVSSTQLALLTGYSSATVRRDLWDLSISGRRGFGYDVSAIRERLGDVIGASSSWRLAIAGAGNLGRALAHYSNLAHRGMEVVALFDIDKRMIGSVDTGIEIYSADKIAKMCGRLGVHIGVIATPASAAQDCASAFIAGGVRALLNFAPSGLDVPRGVEVRKLDVLLELQLLAYHLTSAHPPSW
jgi:redox-sensing transcriptional repressor